MKEAKSRFNGKYNSHICDDEITANPSFFSLPPVNFKREQEQKATEIDDGGGGVGGDGDDNSGWHCKYQLFQKHEQQPNTG